MLKERQFSRMSQQEKSDWRKNNIEIYRAQACDNILSAYSSSTIPLELISTYREYLEKHCSFTDIDLRYARSKDTRLKYKHG